jgi:hypothetical protein
MDIDRKNTRSAPARFDLSQAGDRRPAEVARRPGERRSDAGCHSASGRDAHKWAPRLRRFMDRL